MAYLAVGVLGWLRLEPGPNESVPASMILLALWAAAGILAFAFARPDLLHMAAPDTGPWLAISVAAPLMLLAIHAAGRRGERAG